MNKFKTKKNLLIEDNPEHARVIQEMLAEAGEDSPFDVEHADRLSSGLELLEAGRFDVVLLDLGLPDSQGLATFDTAKARSPELPIIILSLIEDEKLAVEAVRRGAEDYLFKGQVDAKLLRRSIRYAIERKGTERRIKHLNSVLKAIQAVNRLIIVERDRDALIQKICEALVDARGYDAVWLGFLTDDRAFDVIKGSGFKEDVTRFCDYVMRGDYPPCIKKALARKDLFLSVDKSRDCGDCVFRGAYPSKSTAIIRVERANRFFGLLAISLASDVSSDEEEKGLLVGMAGDIAFAFRKMELEEAHKRADEEVKQSLERLQRTFEGTINALASIVEMRDPYTAGHQHRVSVLACAIGQEMGLSEETITGIRMAAVIHDIGKVSIPVELLSKPGPLDEVEFNLIKTHPNVDYDILRGIEFSLPIAEIVLQHHERMNGSGYPQGLKGDNILLEARIIAVADVVEAISSHRPYRPALGIDKALEEISENRSVLYDSDVVDACLKLFAEKGFRFEG